MRARLVVIGAACLMLLLTSPGGAYWTTGVHWASGSQVLMQLEQRSQGTLIDGSPGWNTVTENALALWNQQIGSVEFTVARDSTARTGLGNGFNNVFWADDIYGEPFGDAIAYTKWTYRLSNNTLIEADVMFDEGLSWNSYRGNLRSASRGGTLYDLRRVALHEFGHVLGLTHPDEHGQSVTAIMNSHTSDIDSLQADDISGARALYGSATTTTPTPSNRAPTVSASCSPCSVRVGLTSNLSATATDPDGDSLSYRWTATQGTFSSSSTANTVWTAPGQIGSVTATVTVQDGRGGTASATVALEVLPLDRLPAGGALLVGQFLTSTSGRYRLLYQSDGNLVLYDDVNRLPVWSAGTTGAAPGQFVLQGDGNLVIYNALGAPVWSTGTAGNPNAFLFVQNDGNVVLYRADGQPIWTRSQ